MQQGDNGSLSFYKFVQDAVCRKTDQTNEFDDCLDITMDKLGMITNTIGRWDSSLQMEYGRILEARFIQSQPPVVSAMAYQMIHSEDVHTLVRLEIIRWWRDSTTSRPVSYRDELVPILRQSWDVHREKTGRAYLFNFIGLIMEEHGIPVEDRGVPELLELLVDMILSLTDNSSTDTQSAWSVDKREDFCYRVVMNTRQYLHKDDFTKLLKCLWAEWDQTTEQQNPVLSVSTRILFIHYFATHPQSYHHDIFPTEIFVKFLEDQLGDPHSAPWDRADVASVILNLMDGSVSETLRQHAEDVLRNEYELGRTQGKSRVMSFYQNPENIHCICLQSAQEILDFLHQAYPTLPRHDVLYYDQWIRQCLKQWPQSEKDTDKIWTSLCRIQKDYSVHGERRDRLFHIMRLVVNFIMNDRDHQDELKRRFLEEMIDMAGTCSTGFAVRLLNVLSGYRDFSIRIPPEHALRARFFFLLNNAIVKIEDEETRSIVMDELTLPASHYSERIHFMTFFAAQLPILKEALYEHFKNTMSDTDFDFYLRKCIYHYEGGQGSL